MTNPGRFPSLAFSLVVASLAASTTVQAQVCRGTPHRGGIAYENGKTGNGTAQGASAAVTLGRSALGIGFQSLDSPPGESGFGGTLRYSLVFGDKLQICPGLGLGFEQQTWTASVGTLKSNVLTGRAGIGAGYDFSFGDGFGVAPFLVVEYAERVTYFDLKVTQSSKSDNTGNTGGRAEAQYGLIGRYKRVYAGYVANHTFESGAAFGAHWLVGFAF